MFKEIIRTSIFISTLQKIYAQERLISSTVYKVYLDSQTCKLIFKLQNGTRLNFKYSFLGKISEINKEQSFAVLDTSRVMRKIIKLFNQCKFKILNYSQTSVINSSINKLNKNLYLFPVKTTSIIIIIVMMTNILLSFLLKKEIWLSGLFVYGILLFIACNGLYSNISLEELAKRSYFIRRLNNSCKI